jgi:hypothetical protein
MKDMRSRRTMVWRMGFIWVRERGSRGVARQKSQEEDEAEEGEFVSMTGSTSTH